MSNRWIQENWLVMVGVGLVGMSLAFGGGRENFAANRALGEQAQAERLATRQQELDNRLANERVMRDKAIANERYNLNPVFPVGWDSPDYLASLSPGAIVRDARTGYPLPEGTLVADHSGCTGILDAGGALTALACNADPEVVSDALNRAQPNAINDKRHTGGQ